MAITWLTPPGTTLPSPYEPVRFIATAPVAFVSVSYPGLRVEEHVYRDGAFVYPFADSTSDDSTFSVRRDGGWPNAPTLHVEESEAVASGGVAPALYDPLAQWSLERDQPGGVLHDRSPNGRHLSQIFWGGAEEWFPDMTPGKVVPWRCYLTRSAPDLHLTREMTVTFRNFTFTLAPSIAEGRMLVNCGPNNSLYHTPTQLGYLSRQLYAFNINGNSFAPDPPVEVPMSRWAFVHARRRADGRMILGVDETAQLSADVCQPSGDGMNTININRNGYGNGQNDGIVCDVSVWDKCLTDSELADIRKGSMGL